MFGLKKWALQIAVFALLSVLFVQLFPDAKKVKSLRFYLSLLMMLLVFRPFLNGLNLNQVIKKQAEVWEKSIWNSFGIDEKIEEASDVFAESVFADSSWRMEQWLMEWAENAGLRYESSRIVFDEEQFAQTGELKIEEVELFISGLQTNQKGDLEKQLSTELGLRKEQILLKKGGLQ